MQLTSYAQVKPWAKAVREVVLRRSMPPWHSDKTASHAFRNDRSLNDAEIQTLVAWVDGGAKEGRPAPHPPVESRGPGGWRLGKPDLVIRVPGFKVPAKGTIEYTFLVSQTGFSEDKWVAAAEWKIDQRQVVHHMNAFVRPPGSSYVATAPAGQFYVASKSERLARRSDEKETDRRELLVGYEPGYNPTPWGEGHAKLLRKGSDFVFEMHYTANGKEATDYSELGIYFAKQPPAQRVLTISPADSKLAIPPGNGNFESAVKATFVTDVRLISLQPHMHLRGKAYRITAKYPDGRREVLVNVPKYDFNWQTTYFLREPLALPAGTELECTGWFDNSPNNPNNPDPTKTIYWGDQSWEEMNIGFLEVAFDAHRSPEVAVLSDTTRPGSQVSSR